MRDLLFKGLLLFSSIAAHSLQGVLTTLSKSDGSFYEFSVFMSSLLTESFKLLVSFVLFKYSISHGLADRVLFSAYELLLWAFPAFLYCVANNLYFVVIAISDSPVTQHVFGSLEVLVVGVANYFILHKVLNRYQWVALFLLTSSVASIQLSRSSSMSLSFPVLPACLTVLSSSISGSAGVVIERLMKKRKGISIFQQNTYLYFWGAIFNFIALIAEGGSTFYMNFTLTQFNVYAMLTIANTVVMGLITVGILKHISSVVKSFTSSASLVMTSILSYFLFGFRLSPAFLLSVLNLSIAMYIYKSNSSNVQEKQPQSSGAISPTSVPNDSHDEPESLQDDKEYSIKSQRARKK